MTIFDTVKGTVNTAVDTITSATQSIIEKNRVNAKLNRLRLVMKNESELMNRAYIALGKYYYEQTTRNEEFSKETEAKLFEVIENSKKKIAKARECYREIIDSQNDAIYGKCEPKAKAPVADVLEDITVACSNENEYETSPFEKEPEELTAPVEESVEEAIEAVQEEAKASEADDEESPSGELF